MRILITVFLMCLIVFAASSLMTMEQHEILAMLGGTFETSGEAEKPTSSNAADSSTSKATQPSVSKQAKASLSDSEPTVAPVVTTVDSAVKPTVAKTDSGNPNDLTDLLRAELEQVRQQERQLEMRQESLELIRADLRMQQSKMADLRHEVDSELKAFNKYLVDQRMRGDIAYPSPTPANPTPASATPALAASYAALAGMAASISDTAPQRPAAATLFDNLSSTDAARVLVQMAKVGQVDSVVGILAAMKERNAAKVLVDMSQLDADIAAQIGEQFRLRKQPVS